MPISTLPITAGSSDYDPGGFGAIGTQAYGFGGTLLTWSGESWQVLTSAQLTAISMMLAGTGVDVSFTRDFDSAYAGYTLDAGSGQVLPVMRVTVEAPTYVVAGARIAANGINTWSTTISGVSLTGEIIPISVGPAKITRVHVGQAGGSAQTIDADGNVTLNELAAWSCLSADDCNLVYVRFSPPRGSGRYCDISIVGKKRS